MLQFLGRRENWCWACLLCKFNHSQAPRKPTHRCKCTTKWKWQRINMVWMYLLLPNRTWVTLWACPLHLMDKDKHLPKCIGFQTHAKVWWNPLEDSAPKGSLVVLQSSTLKNPSQSLSVGKSGWKKKLVRSTRNKPVKSTRDIFSLSETRKDNKSISKGVSIS